MDTDSLCYSSQSEDIFQEMSTHLVDFDTSEYPKENVCYSATNATTLGRFKDEVQGDIINEFIGLSPKLCCMVIKKNNINTSSKVIKKAKGVSKGIVKHQLTVDDCRRCFTDREGVYTVNTRFVYKRHEVNTI